MRARPGRRQPVRPGRSRRSPSSRPWQRSGRSFARPVATPRATAPRPRRCCAGCSKGRICRPSCPPWMSTTCSLSPSPYQPASSTRRGSPRRWSCGPGDQASACCPCVGTSTSRASPCSRTARGRSGPPSRTASGSNFARKSRMSCWWRTCPLRATSAARLGGRSCDCSTRPGPVPWWQTASPAEAGREADPV